MFADQAAVAIANAQAFEENRNACEEIASLKARLERGNVYLQEEIRHEHDFDEIVGNSPVLLELLRKVDLVAPSDSSVLLFLGKPARAKN